MKTVLLTFLVFLIYGCVTINNKPKSLIGKWDNSYQIQQKDSTGAWGDWQTINTLVALPQLEFTANGKILWDGKPATGCCQYLSYKFVKNKIEVSDMTPSELCNCIFCEKWEIEKLTDEILEMNSCFNKVRYSRSN